MVATNTPVNDRVAIHTKQAPYRTYVVGARVPAGSVPRLLLWDTADPYHYVRLQGVKTDAGEPSHDVLIVGGEDHKTGQADDADERFAPPRGVDARALPARSERSSTAGRARSWSPSTASPSSAATRCDADNVFIATGDSGNGMTHGTIAGHADHRPDPRPREPVGDALRPLADHPARGRRVRAKRTSTSPRSTRTS